MFIFFFQHSKSLERILNGVTVLGFLLIVTLGASDAKKETFDQQQFFTNGSKGVRERERDTQTHTHN